MSVRPAWVLLHAFGAAGASWNAVALRVDGPVLAPDLPGFGGAPDLPTPSVAAYADHVEAQVRAAGLERAALVGWSMGGKIALALAARRPSWLAGLALVAPSPPSPEPMEDEDRRAQLEGRGDAALARRAVTVLMAPDPPAATVEAAVRERLAVSPAAWRWWLERGSREHLDLGGRIAAPALLATGADDPHLGEEVQRRLTAPHLQTPEIARLERCGHFVPLEAPDRLAPVLRGWAAALPSPRD